MTDSTVADYPLERFIAPRHPGDNRRAVAASRSPTRARNDFAQYRTRPWASVASLAFSIAIVAALWIGWRNRDDGDLTPESGLGYWLGIAGSALMLLLLLYPLRK